MNTDPALYDEILTMLGRQPVPLDAFLRDLPAVTSKHQLKHLLTRLANRMGIALMLTVTNGIERVQVQAESWPRVRAEQEMAASRLKL